MHCSPFPYHTVLVQTHENSILNNNRRKVEEGVLYNSDGIPGGMFLGCCPIDVVDQVRSRSGRGIRQSREIKVDVQSSGGYRETVRNRSRLSGKLRLIVGRDVKKTQDSLIHAKHNGSTWHCAHEVRCHASVEAKHAFLLEDELEALDQSSVLPRATLWWCLTQPSARDLFPMSVLRHQVWKTEPATNLMGICENSREQLCRTSRKELSSPVNGVIPGSLLSATQHNALLPPGKGTLQLLIEDPLQARLCDPKVARRHALVQTPEPLLADNLLNTVPAILVLSLGYSSTVRSCALIQLETGLDEPDRIGGRTSSNASHGRCGKMYPGILLAAIEVVRDQVFTIAICVEVDGPRWDNADQIGAKTTEQASYALVVVDRS